MTGRPARVQVHIATRLDVDSHQLEPRRVTARGCCAVGD
jgi:hypothetical protein